MITAGNAARLAVVVGELLTLLMHRYSTRDPAVAAARMVEAMKAQDRIARAAEHEHAARRRAR